MSADTLQEVTINLAAIIAEQSSDEASRTSSCYTIELNGELLGSEFFAFQSTRHALKGLLHSLRSSIRTIPPGTARVIIISRYQHLIHLGGAGHLPTNHQRQWRSIREGFRSQSKGISSIAPKTMPNSFAPPKQT